MRYHLLQKYSHAPIVLLSPSFIYIVALLVLDPVVEVSVSDADVSVEVEPSPFSAGVVTIGLAKWTCERVAD
jgi:hypothetical protein